MEAVKGCPAAVEACVKLPLPPSACTVSMVAHASHFAFSIAGAAAIASAQHTMMYRFFKGLTSTSVRAGAEQTELPAEVICGLFEALGYAELLEDAAVAAAMEAALCHLAPSFDLQLAQGGRYPGLYRLLAHSNSAVRSIVSVAPACPSQSQ